MRVRFALLLSLGALWGAACGSGANTGSGGSAGDAGPGGPADVITGSCDDRKPQAVPDLPLAPNEVRLTETHDVNVMPRELVLGAALPDPFLFSVARYIGAWSAPGQGARTLRDYVNIGALGTYTRISFRARGLKGLLLGVEMRGGSEQGWRSVETYDPDATDAQRTAVVLAPDAVDPDLWSATFPSEQLVLARARGAPERNEFRLVLRAKDDGASCDALRVESATLRFFAQAPVVLVHGINDNRENCWADYAEIIERAGFIADREVSFGGLADKPGLGGSPPTNNGSVADDVRRIAERLARIPADYGTSDVHLVGHSKGGLDLVNYLATTYPSAQSARALRVLSLQTLATPHGGSVLSDIVSSLRAWAKSHGYDGTSSWPQWGVVVDGTTDASVFDTLTLSGIKEAVLLGAGPIEPGLSDLRTDARAVATDLAWKKDPGIRFATYAFDADFERGRWLNVTGQLTSAPAPSDTFPKYSTDCRGNPIGSNRWTYYCIDEDEVDTFFWGTAVYPPNGTACAGWNTCGSQLWRPLARGMRATVTSADQTLGSRSTIHVDAYGPGVWTGNDLTVAVPSASHPAADKNFVLAGPLPRTVTGLRRFREGGGVEPYVASCKHTGANHISFLRRSRGDIVACTAGDTIHWFADSGPVEATP